jgi:DNA-binding IclR family transcriptional regulator
MADRIALAPQNIAGWEVSIEELERRRLANAELIDFARPHLEWLSRAHNDIPHLASLVDRDGVILLSVGKQLDVMRSARLPGMGAPVQAPDGETIAALKLNIATDSDSASRLLLVAHAAFSIGQQLGWRHSIRSVRQSA